MNELDFDAFHDIFGGLTITLMSAAPLLQELEQCRAALPPPVPGAAPARPLIQPEVFALARLLEDLLPGAPPANADVLRRTLVPLTSQQSEQCRYVLEDTNSQLRSLDAALFLVPALYCQRLPQLLEGWIYPTRVLLHQCVRWSPTQ